MARSLRPLDESVVGRPRTTADLLAAGVSPYELAGPLWTRVMRGTYVWSPAWTDAAMTRMRAAAELMPAGAAIGGWAALHLLGVRDLDGRTGPSAAIELPVLVCVGAAGRMRRRPGVDVDRSSLPQDTTDADGVQVTTAERSCVDVLRLAGLEEGVVAGDGRFGSAR